MVAARSGRQRPVLRTRVEAYDLVEPSTIPEQALPPLSARPAAVTRLCGAGKK
jgi:hypothetical protein